MTRRKLDVYLTPEWATEVLLRSVSLSGNIFECCAGQGDMAKVIALARVGEVFCNDIDPQTLWPDHWDATDPKAWKVNEDPDDPDWDWVVTNPPFNVAPEIVPLAFSHARLGIAMLLRISYLEPVENRGAWLNQHPPTSLIVLPRISFTGDGKTDNVTCAWFVWDKRASGQQIVIAKNPKFAEVAA